MGEAVARGVSPTANSERLRVMGCRRCIGAALGLALAPALYASDLGGWEGTEPEGDWPEVGCDMVTGPWSDGCSGVKSRPEVCLKSFLQGMGYCVLDVEGGACAASGVV